MKLTLPYPISVNAIYGHNWSRKKIYLKQKVKDWYTQVLAENKRKSGPVFTTPVKMLVYHFPPNNKKHDKDNILKIIQDVLCPFVDKGKMYGLNIVKDDNLIYPEVRKGEIVKGGKIIVVLSNYPYETMSYEAVKNL